MTTNPRPRVRGDLLEMVGEPAAAREAYLASADRTTSLPQRRYLLDRAARVRNWAGAPRLVAWR